MEEPLILKNMKYREYIDYADKVMAQAEQKYGHKVLRKRIMLGYLSDSTKPVPGYEGGIVSFKFHDLVMDKTHNLNIKKDLLELGLKSHGKNKIVGVIISDIIDETGKLNKNGVWFILEMPEESDKFIEEIKEEIRETKRKEK